MLAIAALSLVFSAGAIDFRTDAPVVSATECRSCRLIHALSQETQPPLLDAPAPNLSAPGGTVPQAQPLKEDPHAGTIVGKEILVGGLTLLGSDVLALGVTLVLVAPLGIFGTAAVGVVFGALVLSFHALILSPLYCALAIKGFADEPTRHGLGGALLGAYGASLIGGILEVILLILPEMIFGPESSVRVGTPALIWDIVLLVVGAGVRYVGIPAAASWAMHFGKNSSQVATADPSSFRWIPRVLADGRERRPLRAPVIFAW